MNSYSAEGEGLKSIKEELRYLWKEGEGRWIPYVFTEALAKYAGYRLGFIESRLPSSLKKHLSLHSFFWESN